MAAAPSRSRLARSLASILVVALVAIAVGSSVAAAAGYTGPLGPAIVNGAADVNGSGGIGGRDDSNRLYGQTHVIDGALDCDAWTVPNAGVPGDRTIDAADDCTLIGVDGTPDGAAILVEDGRFASVDGAPIANGYRMPGLFNATDPTNMDPSAADFGLWVLDGRVDINLSGDIDGADCRRGVVGALDDEGLGAPADGADVLGAAPTCGNAATPPPSVDGLVDLDDDGRITNADTCSNACFLGFDIVEGSVGGTSQGPAIASFSPTSGQVGTLVTITGSNLGGATAVAFAGTPASITSNTDSQIVASVPVGAATGPITVTTGEGTATSAGVFTVGSGEPPPPGGVHEREVTITLRRALVAQGVVSVLDGTFGCAERALVKIQRRVGGRWMTMQSARTSRTGVYRATLPNLVGRYRALLPNVTLTSGDRCRTARSEVAIRA